MENKINLSRKLLFWILLFSFTFQSIPFVDLRGKLVYGFTSVHVSNNTEISTEHSELLFYHSDHLGSSNLITDFAGDTAQRSLYYPFGETLSERRSETLISKLSYKYTGQELDTETIMYYYGARYYNPILSRFISVDPIYFMKGEGQDLNRYSYVINNPLKNIDPTGKKYSVGVNFRSPSSRLASRLYIPQIYDNLDNLTKTSPIAEELNKEEYKIRILITNNRPSDRTGIGSLHEYNPETKKGVIYINVSVIMKGEGFVSSVINHELGHLEVSEKNKFTISNGVLQITNINSFLLKAGHLFLGDIVYEWETIKLNLDFINRELQNHNSPYSKEQLEKAKEYEEAYREELIREIYSPSRIIGNILKPIQFVSDLSFNFMEGVFNKSQESEE